MGAGSAGIGGGAIGIIGIGIGMSAGGGGGGSIPPESREGDAVSKPLLHTGIVPLPAAPAAICAIRCATGLGTGGAGGGDTLGGIGTSSSGAVVDRLPLIGMINDSPVHRNYPNTDQRDGPMEYAGL